MTAKYSNRESMLHMFCSDYSVIAHLEKVSCALSLNVVNHHVSRCIVTPLTSDALAVSYAVLLKNPAMFFSIHISYQIELKKPMINRYADR